MTPEAARDKKLGIKIQTLRVITCSGICQKAQKERVMNDPQKPPEIQNWGHFCKMCAYDPRPLLAQPLNFTCITCVFHSCISSFADIAQQHLKSTLRCLYNIFLKHKQADNKIWVLAYARFLSFASSFYLAIFSFSECFIIALLLPSLLLIRTLNKK